MKKQAVLLHAFAIVLLTILYAVGQEASPASVPVHIVVMLEARHGTTPPEITREDVMVYEGHDRDRVTDWLPAQGERAALE